MADIVGHRKSGLIAIALLAANLAAAVVLVRSARAALGETADSVRVDRSALHGELAASSHRDFTIQRISTPAGIVVNEYVSGAGTVFAVSWRGPRPPDLSKLLGSYFAEYRDAAAKPNPQRRHLRIQTEHVVVESGGHMGDLWGRAYVPSLLPSGVSVEEIK
jgi:Protein of unknown function (DUF2844)